MIVASRFPCVQCAGQMMPYPLAHEGGTPCQDRDHPVDHQPKRVRIGAWGFLTLVVFLFVLFGALLDKAGAA